jgi:hypothetical protein
MGLSVYPAAAGGGIKLVQRGSAASAGTVTITAVNTAKAFVNVFGTSSSGTVAASGTIGGVTATSNSYRISSTYTTATNLDNFNVYIPSSTISGGTTNLVAAVVQGYLSSSTELVVSGACRWEVVEFA